MKHLVVKDLNNPEILKVERRSDFPANAVCEIDEALVGKAFKVVEEMDAFGFLVKKAVLDEAEEEKRVEAEKQKALSEKQRDDEKKAREQSLKADKVALDHMSIAEVRIVIKKILDHLGL